MVRMAVIAALLCAAAAGAHAGPEDAHVGPENGLVVDEMVFCLGVEERQPVGAGTQFFETTERIYCYTRIGGASGETTVTHVWYYGDAEKARVELPVRSSAWRTWSSKTMLETWSGAWKVDVLGPDGTLLLSKEFVYKPVAE